MTMELSLVQSMYSVLFFLGRGHTGGSWENMEGVMYQSQTLVFFVQSMSSDLIFWFFLGGTHSVTLGLAPSVVLGVTLGHARGTK